MDSILEKIQPQDIAAEMSVLGAMLMDKEAISKAMETLSEDAFYKTAHRKIYTAIIDLFKRDEPVDLVTLANELKKKNELSNIGGAIYLTTILNCVPTAANVEYYTKIIHEKFIKRQLIKLGQETINKGYDADENYIDTLSTLQKQTEDILETGTVGEWVNVNSLLHDQFDLIDKKIERAKREELPGISSGYIDIDKKLGGFQAKDYIILAGRPSMGKSSLALNFIRNMAKTGIVTALFSLESNRESIVNRLLAIEGKVCLNRIRTGYLQPEDFPKLTTAAGKISDTYVPIFLNDEGGIKLSTLISTATKMVRKGAKIIVIDYLQKITGVKAENRNLEIEKINGALSSLAKRLNVPIVALSQLSRNVENRGNKRPMLSDLRDSGSLEQDADIIMFIYRDEYYNPDTNDKGIVEIDFAKYREGETGVVKSIFLKEYVRFEDACLTRQE